MSSVDPVAPPLWPLADQLGTARDLAEYDTEHDTTTIAKHRDFSAFGELANDTNEAVDYLFGFTGQPFDSATGLQNNLNRWYDPSTGRWLSEDPIGFAGGDENLYRYVGNNATGAIDPLGLYEGYWTEVGRTAKGYFWNGPVAIVSGLYNTVRHPVDTAVGIGTAVCHPIDTVMAIKEDFVNKAQTSEGQGQLAFDIATIITPAGLAAKAKYAQKAAEAAKIAEAARATRLAAEASEAARIAEAARVVGKLATSGLRPLAADMPELIWNNTRILGTAQVTRTEGHVLQAVRQMQKMAQSGEYEYITLNRSWKVTTGLKDAAGDRRPDIIGVRRNGIVDAVEVMSRTDKYKTVLKRLEDGMQTLPTKNRGTVRVIPYPYGG